MAQTGLALQLNKYNNNKGSIMELHRRKEDAENGSLAERVKELDKDVQYLRIEFDNFKKTKSISDKELHELITNIDNKFEIHREKEEIQSNNLNLSIINVSKELQKLSADLKEPMEVYKTAKYSFLGGRFIVDTAKWLLPLFIGIGLAYMYFVKD